MRHNKTTKQIFTIIVFAGAVIACSEKVLQLPSSRWDRYLGMTAAMTQVPVPTAIGVSL